MHDEFVLPLAHLALLRLLALLELCAVRLAVLQQTPHSAQSDLAVALYMSYVTRVFVKLQHGQEYSAKNESPP